MSELCDVCGEECWNKHDGIVEDDSTKVCFACLAEGSMSQAEYFGERSATRYSSYPTEKTCSCEDWPCCEHAS